MNWKHTLTYFAWQSIRYAHDRAHFRQIWSYYSDWRRSLTTGNPLSDARPWISYAATAFLEQHIQTNWKIFEYGSGGSTLFLCQRAQKVISVEDNAEWFEKVSSQASKIGNWEGKLVPAELGSPGRSHEHPNHFASRALDKQGLSFEKYARTINEFPANYFDLILIDGRARPSSIQQAISRLKTGGLLFIDNTERRYYLAPFEKTFYQNFMVEFNLYGPTPYEPNFTRSTILRKMK